MASRKPKSMRAAGVVPPSFIMRCAMTRAASRYVTSFINISACSGVLVLVSRTTQASRPAESNVIIDGGGTARFQNV